MIVNELNIKDTTIEVETYFGGASINLNIDGLRISFGNDINSVMLEQLGNFFLETSKLMNTESFDISSKLDENNILKAQIFCRKIGDIIYPLGIVGRSCSFYSDIPADILKRNNMINDILKSIKQKEENPDWKWILQSTSIIVKGKEEYV